LLSWGRIRITREGERGKGEGLAIFGMRRISDFRSGVEGLWSWVGVVARRAYLIPNFLITKVGGVIVIVVMDQFREKKCVQSGHW